MVYIAEAHANDVWPLGKHVDLPSHKNIDERKQAANMLVCQYNFQIPVLLDTMSDHFDQEFAVWPERFFLAKKGTMAEVFHPTIEFGFDLEAIYASLVHHSTLDVPEVACD